jgi:hypothetical protein
MKKIRAFLAVLYAGKEFAKPKAWKNAQLWGSFLVALAGVAELYGFIFNFSENDAVGFATVILGVVNMFITVGSTKKIGFSAKEEQQEEQQEKPQDETSIEPGPGPAPEPDSAPEPARMRHRGEEPTQVQTPVFVRGGAVRPPVERPLGEHFSGWNNRD